MIATRVTVSFLASCVVAPTRCTYYGNILTRPNLYSISSTTLSSACSIRSILVLKRYVPCCQIRTTRHPRDLAIVENCVDRARGLPATFRAKIRRELVLQAGSRHPCQKSPSTNMATRCLTKKQYQACPANCVNGVSVSQATSADSSRRMSISNGRHRSLTRFIARERCSGVTRS